MQISFYKYIGAACQLIVLLLMVLHPSISAAANPPVITQVQGIDVASDTIINATSATIVFTGTAISGDKIQLYAGGQLAGQTTATVDNTWVITARNIMNGSHEFSASVDNWPGTSPASNLVKVSVDTTSTTELPAYMFHINSKSAVQVSERATTSTSVFITLFTNDPAGITTAKISNDGTLWETWNSPPLSPASISWQLPDVPGMRTVYMKFYDEDANESDIITQQIGYFPGFILHTGGKDDETYPATSYDTYPGENKYGSERSSPSLPVTGKSLRLTAP